MRYAGARACIGFQFRCYSEPSAIRRHSGKSSSSPALFSATWFAKFLANCKRIIAVMAAVRTFSVLLKTKTHTAISIVEVEEQIVYWKINYYDQNDNGLSPDPATPS